jgi:hypothetical protein
VLSASFSSALGVLLHVFDSHRVFKCFASDGEKQEIAGKEGKKTEGGVRGAETAAFAAATSKRSCAKLLDRTKLRYVVTVCMRSASKTPRTL